MTFTVGLLAIFGLAAICLQSVRQNMKQQDELASRKRCLRELAQIQMKRPNQIMNQADELR